MVVNPFLPLLKDLTYFDRLIITYLHNLNIFKVNSYYYTQSERFF